ncbi:MAG TPA: MFS transporter [Mycobacteriales bacterium]|nr:MFS transporter [Mycobacteriales bacterium]
MRAYPLYLLLRGLGSLAGGCALTYSLVYQIRDVGLGPFQLVLVGTVLEVTYLIAQLPTGLAADRYGRKPAIVAGTALLGAGIAVQSVPTLVPVLIGTAVSALGSALTDGAEQAWIAGELGDHRAGPAFSRGAQLAQVGTVAGVGVGALLGRHGLRLPMVAGAAGWLLLAGLLALALQETRVAPAADEIRLSRIRPSPATLYVLAAVFVLGLGSEGWDRLGPARLLAFPAVGVLTIGVLTAAAMLGAAGLTELFRRRLDASRAGGLLLAVECVRLPAMTVFAVTGLLPLAAATWLLAGLLRSAAAPLLDTWLVALTDPATRATALSAVGQADSAGQILGGPPIGLLGSRASVPAALLATALLGAPAVALLARARRRGRVGAPA